ncbi:uncharacterized protein LOC109846073 [Asparagus officinalis]|uniref:uncharacterized protein LOC109846073 n=1 Tax=Asparagus officinalis TaxID=4686 RepID=UPI00098E7CA6|nr:uncharacterized protein LOC109846073 [Asparagus officinalis]
MPTIVMEVDLQCHRCYKKIRKAISKLHSRFNIQSTVFDEETNTVTISGPFDADKARKKLCYNAGNSIKDIQIKGTEEEEEKPPEDSNPAEPEEDSKPESEPDEPEENKAKGAEPVAEPAYNGYYGYDWPPLAGL